MPVPAAQMEYMAHPHQFWSCDGKKLMCAFLLQYLNEESDLFKKLGHWMNYNSGDKQQKSLISIS